MKKITPLISHLIKLAHAQMAKTLDVDTAQGPYLIIAPHPDDETLGCGTVILEARKKKCAVHIVVVTDGSASTKSSRISPSELASIRRQETLNACKILDVDEKNVRFLGYKDERTNHDANKIKSDLEKIINETNPGQIFSPYINDIHSDHINIAKEMEKLVADGKISCPVYEYPVWSSIKSDLLRLLLMKEIFVLKRSNSRRQKPAKRKAIYEYKSQLENLTGEANWATLDRGFIDKLTLSPEIFFRVEK